MYVCISRKLIVSKRSRDVVRWRMEMEEANKKKIISDDDDVINVLGPVEPAAVALAVAYTTIIIIESVG